MNFGPYVLDVQKRIPVAVPLSQNDKGNALVFALYSGSEKYNLSGSVLLNGRKPSGKVFTYTGTFSGNVATFTIEEQMTAEPGEVLCEVVHMAGSVRKGSANFVLYCERDPMEDGDVSETDLSLMEEAIAAAGQVVALTDTVEELDETAFRMRDTLPSGDLNDATDPGTYQLVSGNTYTNMPLGATYGNLTVLRPKTGYITQIFTWTDTVDNNYGAWFRCYNGSAWRMWRALQAKLGSTFPASKDADDCLLDGVIYYTDGTWTNTPTSGYYAIIVIRHSSKYFTQIASVTNTLKPIIYVRTTDINGAWSPWVNLPISPESRTVTADTNTAVGGQASYKYGRLVTLAFYAHYTGTLTGGTWTKIATLPRDCVPIANTYVAGILKNTASISNGIEARVNTSGEVQIQPQSNVTTSTTLYIRISGTLITAS